MMPLDKSVREVLFCDEGSPLGQEKKRFFGQHRLIYPLYSEMTPDFRISWEELARQIETTNTTADQLAVGPAVSADEVFRDEMLTLLTEAFPGWDQGLGFDHDAFAVVDDLNLNDVRLHVELYPRESMGQPVTAYTSAIRFVVPFKLDQYVDHDEKDLIIMLVIEDAIKEGTDPTQSINQFGAGEPCRIKSHSAKGLFLNKVAYSVVESDWSEPHTVVTSRSLVGSDGKTRQAKIYMRLV